jgi:hypothetical protein
MLSRRKVLGAIGSVTAVGLAGCSGSSSGGSDSVDCQTEALAHGDGDLLDAGASATVEDGAVRLVVPLSADAVDDQNADSLRLHDAAGTLAHSIPVSADDAEGMSNKAGVSDGRLRYEQYLGERPLHGEYRVVAFDENDETLDSITIAFNCFPESQSDE